MSTESNWTDVDRLLVVIATINTTLHECVDLDGQVPILIYDITFQKTKKESIKIRDGQVSRREHWPVSDKFQMQRS
jgi:hypothetical protein